MDLSVLRDHALQLSHSERVQLAQELLASLRKEDSPAAVRAAWAAEIDRRAELALAGKVELIDADDVCREIEDELRNARSR